MDALSNPYDRCTDIDEHHGETSWLERMMIVVFVICIHFRMAPARTMSRLPQELLLLAVR